VQNQPLNVAFPKFPILNGSFHQQQPFDKNLAEGWSRPTRDVRFIKTGSM